MECVWRHDIDQGFNDSMIWWPRTIQPCTGQIMIIFLNIFIKTKSFFYFMQHCLESVTRKNTKIRKRFNIFPSSLLGCSSFFYRYYFGHKLVNVIIWSKNKEPSRISFLYVSVHLEKGNLVKHHNHSCYVIHCSSRCRIVLGFFSPFFLLNFPPPLLPTLCQGKISGKLFWIIELKKKKFKDIFQIF